MSNSINDTILENLQEEVESEHPTWSEEQVAQEVEKRFQALPEGDV